MSYLELRANLKIRPGQLAGFKAQAAEIMRLTKELDTQTLRYDWFISEDGTECEVHEAYKSEDGLLEHNQHILDARAKLFRDFADGHRMTAYGDISPKLVEVATKYAGGVAHWTFLQGLQLEPMV